MAQTVFIALHAASAVVALTAGVVGGRRPGWFAIYYWSLALMLGFLVLAIAVDLDGRGPAVLDVDGALVGLGCFMMWKAERARRVRDVRSPRFVDHVGFTIVGLVDAFVVVTVFNLGVRGWLVAIIGAAIAVAGHVVIGVVRDRSRPDVGIAVMLST